MRFDSEFYKNRRVLITGHTGFKGTWMCKVLVNAGANVTGYALEPPTDPSLYRVCGLDKSINSVIGDIRDLDYLLQVFAECKPEIVIHMAAQPIVRDSYKNPVYTYDTNVMGTVNILEAVRLCSSVKSFVNVTTDKVYLNKEWTWGYRENEELNGYDPYSNSKSCSELVTSSYKNSFFGGESGVMEDGRVIAITTCRAGNVIGGGDFANDRIIPDCIRAVLAGKEILVRNPYSTRPYQHVLEPVVAYLQIAQRQYSDVKYAGNYNVGPDDIDCRTTGELVTLFCEKWNRAIAGDSRFDEANWVNKHDGGPHESQFLKLDCSKLKTIFEWKPRWNVETAMEKIVEWSLAYLKKENINELMDKQIEEFIYESLHHK